MDLFTACVVFLKLFHVLNYIRFWLELFNQIFLKYNLKKWFAPHLKWLFVKVLIFYILMVIAMKKPICDMIIIKLFS